VIVYVDSSSGWITQKAKKQVQKYQLFKRVIGEHFDMGFCIVAEKAGDFEPSVLLIDGDERQEKLANLLRCPVDKSRVRFDGKHFCCEFQHRFPIHDGFPVMIAEKAMPKTK
jgi:uncharacterized protein YbaR (Trm112 family)